MNNLCSFFVLLCCVIGVWTEDSYLEALQESHSQNLSNDNQRVARDDYTEYSSGPGYDYHHPAPSYGPPPSAYGPPTHHDEYHHDHHDHHIDYHHHHYAPPHHPPPHHVAPMYHAPRESWFLDKLKLKFDLFTLGKILLKLILFKKMVKFIAVICLLLFLPKLQHDKESHHDDGGVHDDELRRRIDVEYDVNARLNEVTNFTLTALDAFAQKYNKESCTSREIFCRLQRMVDTVDEKYPYNRMYEMYRPSERIGTVFVEGTDATNSDMGNGVAASNGQVATTTTTVTKTVSPSS